MVGILVSNLGWPIFRGYVSFREGKLFFFFGGGLRVERLRFLPMVRCHEDWYIFFPKKGGQHYLRWLVNTNSSTNISLDSFFMIYCRWFLIPRNRTHRTHVSRTPNHKTWVSIIARASNLLLRGPLGFGPIQFLMDWCYDLFQAVSGWNSGTENFSAKRLGDIRKNPRSQGVAVRYPKIGRQVGAWA